MNFNCRTCEKDILGVAKVSDRGIVHPECFDKPQIIMNKNFVKVLENLPSSDETGRYFVKSMRTGKVYCVEPIGNPHIGWGDVDPVTKKLTGQYGDKYRGAIDKKDSIITEDNGFKNIKELGSGVSPESAIEEIDAQYPTI
jgi:hypothetical protein